jgi:SAM-dependent methyltransferase
MDSDGAPVGFDAAGMWDSLAATWDARGEWHADITRDLTVAMVDALAPMAGETIVELACGPTADAAMEVDRRLAGDVRLSAADLSQRMVDAARRRAARDHAAISFATLDVTALALPAGSVDGLLARWVYMLLPDPRQALGEARRVLRRGGRLVFAVFASAAQNPFFTLPGAVLADRGLFQPPEPGRPSMFALADSAATTRMIESAGFAASSVRDVPLTYRLSDPDDLWSMVSEFAGPVSLALRGQDASVRAEIRTEIELRAEAFRDGTGYALPGLALVFTATT